MAALALAAVQADSFATVRAWRRMVSAGFSLIVRDDKLVASPADRLSEQQRAYIRHHKTALVALIDDS